MHLTEQEQRQINELVAEVEAKSGAQLRLACHPEADAYPDIPWKAFALGATAASLFIIVHEGLRPDWPSIHCAAFDVVVILGGGGATLARLTIFWPPVRTVARLYSICIPDSVLGDVSGRTDGALALLITYLIGFPVAKLLVARASWYEKARNDLKTRGKPPSAVSHAAAAGRAARRGVRAPVAFRVGAEVRAAAALQAAGKSESACAADAGA